MLSSNTLSCYSIIAGTLPNVCPSEKSGSGFTEVSSSIVGMWHADWISGDEICKNDDKAPQYIRDDSIFWMFDNQDGCCNRFLSYKLSDCLGISDVLSNKYFPHRSKDDNGCKQ